MKSRQIKLSARALAQLKRDPRIKELYATMQTRPLNIVERIILQQLISEANNGAL